MPSLIVDNGSGRFDSKKNFGKITNAGFQAIQNNKLDSYTPATDYEKKTIDEYKKYVANNAVKSLETSVTNAGGSLFAAANGITVPKRSTKSPGNDKVNKKAQEFKKAYTLEELMRASYLTKQNSGEQPSYDDDDYVQWENTQREIAALDRAINETLDSYTVKELEGLIYNFNSLLRSNSLEHPGNVTEKYLPYQKIYQQFLPDAIKKLEDALKKREKAHPEEISYHAGDALVYGIIDGYINNKVGKEYAKMSEGKPNEAKKWEGWQKTFEERRKGADPDNWFEESANFAGGLAGQQAEMSLSSLGYAAIGAAAAAVAGQLGPQVALPEEIISVPIAAMGSYAFGNVLQMNDIEKGHAYKEMIDAGVSPENAQKYATGVGLTNALLETVQLR